MGCIFSKPSQVVPTSENVDRHLPKPRKAWPPPEENESTVITSQPRPNEVSLPVPPITDTDSKAKPQSSLKTQEIPVHFRIIRCDYSVEHQCHRNEIIDPSLFPYEDLPLSVDVASSLDQCRQKVVENFPLVKFAFLRRGKMIEEDRESKIPVFDVLLKSPGQPLKETFTFKGIEYRTITWKGKQRTVIALVNAVVIPGAKDVEEGIDSVDEAEASVKGATPGTIPVCFRIRHSTVVPIIHGNFHQHTEQQMTKNEGILTESIRMDKSCEQQPMSTDGGDEKQISLPGSVENDTSNTVAKEIQHTDQDEAGRQDNVHVGEEKYGKDDSTNVNECRSSSEHQQDIQTIEDKEQNIISRDINQQQDLVNAKTGDRSTSELHQSDMVQSERHGNSDSTGVAVSGSGETINDQQRSSSGAEKNVFPICKPNETDGMEESQSNSAISRAIHNSFQDIILQVDQTTTIEYCRHKIREKTTNDEFFFLKNGKVIPRSKEGRLMVFQVLPKVPSKHLNDGFRYHGVQYHSAQWNDRVVTFAGLVDVVPVPEGRHIEEVLECLGPSRIEGDDVPNGGFHFIPFDKYSRMMTFNPTGLHVAASYGRTALVNTILSTFKSLDSVHLTDSRNATPLHYAAANGHDTTVLCLLENQCQQYIDSQDINGRTPLHLAIYYNKFTTVVILLQRGASMRGKKDVNGNTPMSLLLKLPLAFWESHIDKLKLPADLAKHVASKMIVEKRTEKLDKAVECIADVNARDLLQRTLLHEAAEAKSDEAIQLLLGRGARKDLEDTSGCIPLCIASRQGSSGVIDNFLTDAVDHKHLCHAFLHALQCKRIGIIVSLLRHPNMNFDTSTRASFINVLDRGRLKDNDVLKILEACHDTLTNQRFLGWICANGTKDHVQHFVNTGVDVSMHDYMGRTVLHEAAQKGDHEMVQYLLENTQAETNLVDWRGSTPLHCACEKGRDDIAHFLLERENVLASVRDINGRTPLLTALHNKKTSLALGLVKRFGNRLDLSCADKLGFTALHFTYLFKGDDARKFANSMNEPNGDNKEMAVRYEVQHNYRTVNELWNYHLDTKIHPMTKLSKRLRKRWHSAMSSMESDRAKKSDTPSPLCLAVISGNVDAVLTLADDMKSMTHRSPLEIAVMHDKRIILDALLDKYKALGIDQPSLSDVCQYELQNIQNQRGQYDGIHPRDGPGLYRACKAGNKAAVQDLLKFGADVTARFNGKTCLDVCIDEDREAIALELLEHVITKTKTSDVVGNKGICHLILRAAGRDQWKLVERMIELDDFMQSDINTKLVSDSCNQTIIHHMARAGQLKMLQRILNKDIVDALNQVGKYHRTPLWFAIANEHWEVAKLLFLYDLNPLSGDASMDMFFHRLMRMNNPTFDSVLKGGCVVSDTQPCSEYIGRRRISKAYMAIFGSELVADTIYYDRCERKTNYWSVKEAKSSANNLKSGENECKKQVRSDNAPAHINSKYTLRRPKTEKEEKVYREAKLLFALASNAATNSKSILHLAASRSQLEYARAILSFRPDLVDIPDIEGRTPLFYAALAGNKEMVCLILEKGACQIHASTILTVLLAYYINCKELSHTEIYYQGGIKYRTTDSANDDQGIDDMQIKVYDEIDWLKLKANSVTYLFNETVSLLTWRKRQILTDSASVKKNNLYDVLAILLKNDPRCITDSKSAPSVALVLCALHDAKVLTLFVNGGFDLCRIIQELIFPKLLFITHTEEGQWETKETIYVDSITAEMLIISTVSNASDCLDDAFECLLVLLSKINAISKPTIAKLAVEASAKGKWALLEKILKCATFQELMMAEKLVQDRDGRTVIHYLAKEGQLGYLDEILKEDSYEETLAFDTIDQSLRTPLWYAVAFKHWDVAKKLILLGSCPLKCKTDIHSLMFRFRKFDREGKYKEGLDYFTVGKHPAPLGKYRRGQARPKDQMQELLEHKSKLVKSKTGRKISESARKEKYGSLGVYEAIFHQTDIFTTLVSKGSKLQPEVKKGTDAKTKRLTDKPRSDKEEGFFHRSHKIAQPSKIDVQAMKEVQQLYNLAVCAGNNGAKLLHIAAAAGDVELSKEIIKYRKSFVNCLDSSGMTALFYAVRSGYEETVRCLLENGANARIGLSPLLVSATMWYLTENGSNTTRGQNVLNAWPSKMVSGHMKGLVTFQRFMLDFKESKRNWRLTTKLLLSEVKGLVSEQEVLTLALSILREEGTIADFLSSGFDINTSLSNKSMHSGKDSDTDTLMSPEDVIYVTSSMKMPQSSIARCLDFLLRSGDNETLQRTLLSCMRHSLWDVIYTLIDMFNLQLDNVAAVSLLVKCAEENQVDLVKRLAERLDVSGGVDVGHNHLLVVALHTACKKGHVEMVELLLQTNQIGSFTKISLAEDKPQSLWDTNLPYDNTCQWYVKQQWPRHLELQLDGESKVLKNKQYRSHWTAFHWACHSGKLDVLKALETIAGGIEKAKGVMSEHFNPIELLYVSTLAGHASVFSYLCDDWNLDPSVRLNVSHLWEESHKFKLNFDPSPTSLEIAAVHGHHKIVMLLLQKAEQLGSGFELIKYPADLGPITLYHVASFYGWKDVIDILDQLGLPERSRQDGCGLTPAAYALSTGRRKLYEQLCSTELDENGVFDDHHGKISEITEENTICSFGWLRNHLISNKNNPTTALTQPTDAKQRDPQERAPYKFHYAGYTNDALKCMVTASALDMPHVWQNGDGYIRECFTDMLASAAFCGYANLLDLFLAGKEEVQRKEILSSRRTFDSWIGYMNDNRKECVQKLIDYGAPVSEYTLDFAIRSSSNDGVITLLRNSLGSEGIRKSDAKLGACAVGRNKLLTELTEEVPSFDDHIEGHSDKIDPTCFHCLRIRSVRWFDKFVKRVDVAKNDMLIIKSSSTPRLADRLSLPPEQLKEYQWILGHGNEMADFKKTMLGTIFYNTSDDLSDMGLNQESICHLLNACYMKNTKNKIGEARVPNAAIVALDKAVQLSPENFRSDLVKLFIEFHEDMGEKQLLHVAVTLHLQGLTQTMMSLCNGDTVYKGQTVEEVAKAFNYTEPLPQSATGIPSNKKLLKQ